MNDARRYEVVRPMDERGSSATFLARLHGPFGFDKPVVLHAIRASAGARVRIAREARLAARLCHANVISTLDMSADDEAVYLVTEWVDGRRVSTFERPVPLPIACAVVHDVLSALAYAHACGVLHGAVDAASVIVGADGLARVDGFATARAEHVVTVTERDDLRAAVDLLTTLAGADAARNVACALGSVTKRGAAEMARVLALTVACAERRDVAAFANRVSSPPRAAARASRTRASKLGSFVRVAIVGLSLAAGIAVGAILDGSALAKERGRAADAPRAPSPRK